MWEGHIEGVKKLKEFTQWCLENQGIRKLSVFALSTDNLGRPEKEVEELWRIYKVELASLAKDPLIAKHGVQVRILGNDALWKPDVKNVVGNVIDSTKHYSKHILNILLAYGSKFEIANAVKKVAGKPFDVLDRFLLEKDPLHLIIRTGGQCRLSNFMLYQASYANIYFEKKLWPEVTKRDFKKWLDWYKVQENKFGR